MKHQFKVPEMTCGHCKMRIEKAMNGSGEVSELNIDLQSKTVSLESELPVEGLIRLFDEAGYDAEKI